MNPAFKSPKVPVTIGGHDLFLLYSIPALAGLQAALGAESPQAMLDRVDAMLPRADTAPDTSGMLELLRAGLQVSADRAGVDVSPILEEMTPGEIVAYIVPMFDALFRALGAPRVEGAETGEARPIETASAT